MRTVTLSQLRTRALRLADLENASSWVTDAEVNDYINEAIAKWWDIIASSQANEWFKEWFISQTEPDVDTYPLDPAPQGWEEANPASRMTLQTDFYKLLGVDLIYGDLPVDGLGSPAMVTSAAGSKSLPRDVHVVELTPFMNNERNWPKRHDYQAVADYNWQNVTPKYRLHGDHQTTNTWQDLSSSAGVRTPVIRFTPAPESYYYFRVWYLPHAPTLVSDTDLLPSINGWEEYIVADVAQKLLTKEESDPSAVIAIKQEIEASMRESADEQDASALDVIQDYYNRSVPAPYSVSRGAANKWVAQDTTKVLSKLHGEYIPGTSLSRYGERFYSVPVGDAAELGQAGTEGMPTVGVTFTITDPAIFNVNSSLWDGAATDGNIKYKTLVSIGKFGGINADNTGPPATINRGLWIGLRTSGSTVRLCGAVYSASYNGWSYIDFTINATTAFGSAWDYTKLHSFTMGLFEDGFGFNRIAYTFSPEGTASSSEYGFGSNGELIGPVGSAWEPFVNADNILVGTCEVPSSTVSTIDKPASLGDGVHIEGVVLAAFHPTTTSGAGNLEGPAADDLLEWASRCAGEQTLQFLPTTGVDGNQRLYRVADAFDSAGVPLTTWSCHNHGGVLPHNLSLVATTDPADGSDPIEPVQTTVLNDWELF